MKTEDALAQRQWFIIDAQGMILGLNDHPAYIDFLLGRVRRWLEQDGLDVTHNEMARKA